jgi:flavin-dependent dehydrogenase
VRGGELPPGDAAWDLVVIGGGPAGASAAIRAASKGLRVQVLEAARFPRDHVGESLVYLWDSFRLLGVEDRMDSTFQHKYGSCRVWGRDPELRWTRFEHVPGARDYSLQVERSQFDQMLLQRAAEVGAQVRQGCRVTEVVLAGERAVGVRFRTADGARGEERARWVLDASGRSGLVTRARGRREVDPYFPDLSVYAYLRGMLRFPGELAGNLLIEAIPWGWIWSIPLHTGEVSVGVVCDVDTRGELRARGLDGFFRQALGQSAVVRGLVRDARVARGPFAAASGGYRSLAFCGPGWLAAGDAAAFVDPMWATGVANAITDGIAAAAVVEAVLSGRLDEAVVLDYFQRGSADRATLTLNLVRFIYRSQRLHADAPFWRERRRRTNRGGEVPEPVLLRRLARDASVRYFRDALEGMRLEEDGLRPLRDQVERERRADAMFGALLLDLESWRPALAPGVVVRRAIGPTPDQWLVAGVELVHEGAVEFVGDPVLGSLLERVDGRRSAASLTAEAVARAPAGTRLVKRWEAAATLADAFRRGLIEVVAEARPATAPQLLTAKRATLGSTTRS